jgi:hypothetical protein
MAMRASPAPLARKWPGCFGRPGFFFANPMHRQKTNMNKNSELGFVDEA